jgi:superfamily II DNA/RNA helicase
MSFDVLELHPSLHKAIAQSGYTTPTPIQAEAIPAILTGQDLIASAQTGTGKTAAFMLPALQRFTAPATGNRRLPRVLVLTPTRELANQIIEAARKYGKFLRFNAASFLGGMPYREQLRQLSGPLDLVVATPGRLLDHLDRGRIDLSGIELLVLDEADRMLDMGFIDDVEKIARTTPTSRQTLLFTATLNSSLIQLSKRLLKEPQRIEIANTPVHQPHIEQRLHVADDLAHKNRLLQHLASDVSVTKAIIFSATKRDADDLAQSLRARGHDAAALHGDMNQMARNRTLAHLRGGKLRLLVATDVAARGIDVTGISHVINYDMPKFPEDYVHRIGRTGRAGASGIAVSLALPQDARHLERIERYTGQAVPVHEIPGLEPTRELRRGAPRKASPRRPGSAPARGGYRDSKSQGFAQHRTIDDTGGRRHDFHAPNSRTQRPRPQRHG